MAALHVEPMETCEDDYCAKREGIDDDDDWLFASIKSYNHLHMYELQNQPTAIDFTFHLGAWSFASGIDNRPDNALCIGCNNENGGSEILQLRIPGKLLPKNEHDEKEQKCFNTSTLSKDRDFSLLSGGLHNRPIGDICCLPSLTGTRNIVVTEENNNSVGIWSLGNDVSEMCKLKGYIENENKGTKTAKVCVSGKSSQANSVIFGSSIKDICVADHTSMKVIHAPCHSQEDSIHSLSFLDEDNVLIFSEEGQAWLMDIREKGTLNEIIPKCSTSTGDKVNWSCDMQSSQTFVRVNDQGFGDYRDVRNSKSTHDFQLKVPQKSKNGEIQIRISPDPDSKVISLSGLDGNVYLFDLSKVTDTEKTLVPIFTHRGHSACSETPGIVTKSTVWYPCYPWHKPSLLFSTASDGSLHAWDYNCETNI